MKGGVAALRAAVRRFHFTQKLLTPLSSQSCQHPIQVLNKPVYLLLADNQRRHKAQHLVARKVDDAPALQHPVHHVHTPADALFAQDQTNQQTPAPRSRGPARELFGQFIQTGQKIGALLLHAFQKARSQQGLQHHQIMLEGQEFPLPESVVSMHRTEYENELRSYLQQQGLDKDAVENSIKSMSDECRKQGEERARAFLFLMALARREKLEVQPQEIDFQIMQMAQQYKEDYHKLRETLYSNGAVSDIRDRMLNRKALNLLFDKAQKTEAAQESQPAAE